MNAAIHFVALAASVIGHASILEACWLQPRPALFAGRNPPLGNGNYDPFTGSSQSFQPVLAA